MKLTWTKTDEAPALASYALLPILQSYFKGTGVEIETADISLAGRIVANFPERLRDDQKIPDELTRLGKLAKTPRVRNSGKPSPNCRARDTTYPTIPKLPPPMRPARCRLVLPSSWALRSIPYCVKAIRTAALRHR